MNDISGAPVRYIVIGAGTVGGTIGGCLFQGGHDVVLVARGAHLDALRAHGLRLATPMGTQMLRVPAVGGPAELELRGGDVLILSTKGQDTVSVLEQWAWQPVGAAGKAAAQLLPVVCAQNGVANEGIALRRFRYVYGMCVWVPATHLQPGTVTAAGRWEVPGIGPLLLAAHAVLEDYPAIGLADAMNAVLAREFRTDVIATLDHRHFRVIRPLTPHGAFRLLPADVP